MDVGARQQAESNDRPVPTYDLDLLRFVRAQMLVTNAEAMDALVKARAAGDLEAMAMAERVLDQIHEQLRLNVAYQAEERADQQSAAIQRQSRVLAVATWVLSAATVVLAAATVALVMVTARHGG